MTVSYTFSFRVCAGTWQTSGVLGNSLVTRLRKQVSDPRGEPTASLSSTSKGDKEEGLSRKQ